MRNARINQKTIYYATYQDNIPIMDGDYETGEYESGYSNPIEVKMNVSASKGEAIVQPFGTDVSYSKVLCTCDMDLPIDENTVLWVDIAPTLNEDGSTDTEHDYKVVRVAKGLQNVLYAIEKV